MNITLSISKDKVAALPTVMYDGYITVIENEHTALKAIEYLNMQQIVGFDTETKPSFRKGGRPNNVSLVQISTEHRCFLFRINKIGFIDELKQFIENEKVKKVGLSLKDDFNMLHKLGEFTPKGFIDLQKYVKQFGIADNSLQKIYAIVFGGRISKGQRLSNWEANELTIGQQHYAAIDAWSCLQLYHQLSSGQFVPENSEYIVEPIEENS